MSQGPAIVVPMTTICVLGTVSESIDATTFDHLLADLCARFGPEQGSYFVHRDPPRAIEFSCDDTEREAACTWLRARPEVADVRVDQIQEP